MTSSHEFNGFLVLSRRRQYLIGPKCVIPLVRTWVRSLPVAASEKSSNAVAVVQLEVDGIIFSLSLAKTLTTLKVAVVVIL